MTDNSQDDLRDRLDKELSEADEQFTAELYRRASWEFWLGSRNHRLILGPYNSMQLGVIYRYILLALFIAGVTLTVISQETRELGVALVVGSLFGLGAFLAQAWNLLREQEFALQNDLVSDVYDRDLRRYAAQMKGISNRIEALEKLGDSMEPDKE